MNIINLLNKNNLIVLTVTLYIFFWDLFYTLGIKFDPRIITLLLVFFLLKEIFIDLKNKKFEFFYISSIILVFLVTHSYFVKNLFNLKLLLSITFLIYLFGIAYYFHDVILKNKKKIIYLFVSLFLISILLHFFLEYSSNREPFSCGAIKNLIGGKNDFDSYVFILHFLSSYSLIFNENSHLAMSGVPVIVYSLYLFSQKSESKFKILVLIIFIIICFLKSSATLIVGTAFSLLAIIIFEIKRINRYFLILSLIFISINFIIFFQDKVCVNKLVLDNHNLQKLDEVNPFSEKKLYKNKIFEINNKLKNQNLNQNLNQNEIDELNLSVKKYEELLSNKNKKKPTYIGSLSSDVFFHAFKVTYNSIFSSPFGRGFQGYELAFHDYNSENFVQKKWLKSYNDKDASNTLFKIITEFGVFSIFLYLMLFFIFLNNQIPIDNKIFLMSFIVTQTIRGAGYFNGAFLFIIFLLFMVYFKKSEILN